MLRRLFVVGMVAAVSISSALAIEVTITSPSGLGKYVRGDEVTFTCSVEDEGDTKYWVWWKRRGQNGDQLVEASGRVDHTYDGSCDNSAGSGHLGSTDWDLQG